MRSGENDPRSLFYKRVLDRPKVPAGRLSLCLILVAGGGAAGFFLARWAGTAALWSWLCGGAVAMGMCLLLAKHLLIAAVETYQALAPTKVRMRCRYEPSCSVYMLRAVEKYGFWRGFPKGMKRWRGCKPPNGGFDPI